MTTLYGFHGTQWMHDWWHLKNNKMRDNNKQHGIEWSGGGGVEVDTGRTMWINFRTTEHKFFGTKAWISSNIVIASSSSSLCASSFGEFICQNVIYLLALAFFVFFIFIFHFSLARWREQKIANNGKEIHSNVWIKRGSQHFLGRLNCTQNTLHGLTTLSAEIIVTMRKKKLYFLFSNFTIGDDDPLWIQQ